MNKNNSYIIKSFMKRFLLLLVFMVTSTSVWAINALGNSNLRSNLDNHINHLIDETVSNYRFEFFFAPPTNDLCDGAKVIVPSTTDTCDATQKISVDLTGSTASGKGKPSCDTAGGSSNQMMDQWFKFTAIGDVHTLLVSNIRGTGTVRGVLYHNVQANGTVITCTNLGGGNSVRNCDISFINADSKFRFENLVPGKEYIFRLYTHGASTKTFDLCLYTPPPAIKVSKSGDMYSVDELIKDVLVSATCDLVSNVRYQHGDGTAKNNVVNGIGYFSRNNADFAFEEGIVLGTGNVDLFGRHYVGPTDADRNPGLTGDRRWEGDKDLKDLVAATGGYPSGVRDMRSSQVEFDFIPVQETISFEYLFGSISYYTGCTYHCGNGAMFGAWLVDTTTGIGFNTAIMPGTANTPISMGTVRDKDKLLNAANCVSVNPQFFDRCFDGNYTIANPNVDSPVDLAGISVAFKSDDIPVVPGRKYRIKLAVLDYCPTAGHVSAAFFKAGSFDIGTPELGSDMSIEQGNAACPGETVELGVNLDPQHYLIQWTKDGRDLVGENGPKLYVTTPGLYGAKLSYKDVDCDIEPQSVLVEYYDPIIFEKNPTDLEVCRSGGPNTIVNLEKAMTGVTYSDVSFTFHETKADAETTGAAFIDPNYQVDSSVTSKVIWVRIQKNNTPCFEVRSFRVNLITCTLALMDLPNMEVCQNENPNIGPVFDLTINDALVYYGRPGYTITYYKSVTDARGKLNPISTVDAKAYQGTNNEEIWVRVEETANPAINSVTSFKLVIHPLPVINNNVAPLYACLANATDTSANFNLGSKDNEITLSASSLQVTYYETLVDAQNGDITKALNKSSYLSGEKEIYFRVESLRSGCFRTGSFVLRLSPAFELVGSNVYYQCSENGYAQFNLDAIAGFKIAGNTIPLTPRYYTTNNEAELEINAIVLQNGRYTNRIYGSETIYLRVNNANGCYKIQPIELKVEKAPETNTPTPIMVCATSNGSAVTVDITSKLSEVLGSTDPDTVNVRYYSSYAMAVDGRMNLAIIDPENYSNAMGNTVYVRVESRTTACFSIESITIQMNTLPSVPQVIPDYEVCDNESNLGIATFILRDMKPKISSSNEYVISFHKTATDAEAGINKLDETSYINEEPFSQVIYVRVVDVKTGCYVIRQFFLKVNQYPLYDMANGGTLIQCTSSTSSQAEFNLVFASQTYIQNSSDYETTFYENLGDAQNNINQIRNPESYINQQVGGAKIWFRIKNKRTGCIGFYEITLKVENAPILPVNLPVITMCDTYNDPFDGIMQFDITIHENIIYQSLKAGHTGEIVYYRSKEEAETDTNRIVDPTIYQNAGSDTIWYRLIDTTTGCYAIEFFKFKINTPLRLENPIPITKCSDLTIGQNKAVFDLTQNILAIIGGTPIFGLVYEYYEKESDALAKINAIPTSNIRNYVNKTASQDIWIVVTNEFGCSSTVIQKITAEAMPMPNNKPTKLETCEIEFGKKTGIFDLRIGERDILKGDSSLSLTIYRSQADATAKENELTEEQKANFTSVSGKVYVRVENKNSTQEEKCYVIVELDLVVNLKPIINVKPYVVCLDTPGDHYPFDLATKNDEILNGRNQDDFRITYYVKEIDAISNANALLYQYTNEEPKKQTIYIRLDDKKTGCFHVVPLLLQIEQKVYAYDIIEPDNINELIKCSNPSTGTAEFDFTKFGEDIAGDQGGVQVIYYLGDSDYLADKPINPINKIVLPVGKHKIIAVVKKTERDMYCTAEMTFMVEVLDTPVAPRLKTGDIVCIDYQSGKLIEPYVFDSGFDSSLYDFQWEYQEPSGRYLEIPGATNSYYVVNDISLGNTFRVVVNYKGGTCKSTSTTVKVEFVPEIPIKVKGADSTGLIGSFDDTDNVIIEIESPVNSTMYEFALDGGAYQDSRFFYDVTNGSHRVWVRFKDNKSICPQYIDIFVLGYPKFFTPNGDGFNDTWNIKQLQGHPEAVIYIFDRHGKLITQLKPSGQGWDGTFNGKPLPATDYWFTVEYLQEPEKANEMPRKVHHKGHFSLKR